MFLAGRSRAHHVCCCDLPALLQALERAGYVEHKGPRITRSRELVAYVRPLEREPRQIHVQIIDCGPGAGFDVFAHTEPWGWGLAHLWAALTDRVSYQHGARILRADLGVGREGERAA